MAYLLGQLLHRLFLRSFDSHDFTDYYVSSNGCDHTRQVTGGITSYNKHPFDIV